MTIKNIGELSEPVEVPESLEFNNIVNIPVSTAKNTKTPNIRKRWILFMPNRQGDMLEGHSFSHIRTLVMEQLIFREIHNDIESSLKRVLFENDKNG